MGTFLYTPLFPLSSHHVLLKILVYFKQPFERIIGKFFLKVQSQSQKKHNSKIKQQGIQVDRLYFHNEVSFKHIAPSRLVHDQLNNTYSKIK